jgi:DNA-directed RNA polymerase subunit M/transcription elongation factor TFIIS
MVENDSKLSSKVVKKFTCILCDYTTSKSYDYNKHLSTYKHKKTENGSKMVENGIAKSPKVAESFQCEKCGKH